MSNIVKLPQDLFSQVQLEFLEMLSASRISDGKISFSKTFPKLNEKATVYFTPSAYTKMIFILREFSKEVAWHGIATRFNEENNEYLISDILVFPQEVTDATVNTDQEEYQNWLYALDDEQFNNLRMHGHSHVNMATSPSSVDLSHQEKILAQLKDDMFYIFMIWNKSLQRNIRIYEMKKNIYFENTDIEVKILDNGQSIDDFIQSAKDMVKSRVTTTTSSYNPMKTYTPPATTVPIPATSTKPATTTQTQPGNQKTKKNFDEFSAPNNAYNNYWDKLSDPFYAHDGYWED